MAGNIPPAFKDNPVIKGREDRYLTIDILSDAVLRSWQVSLFSFEWMHQDGRLRTLEELPESEQEKRRQVEDSLSRLQPLERPILGIGLMDNIEIGSGRAVFLTLAAAGIKKISVHIPRSHEEEFDIFKA